MSRSARLIVIVGALALFAGTLAWLRAGEPPAALQSPADPAAASPTLPSKTIGNSVLSHGGPSPNAGSAPRTVPTPPQASPDRAPADPPDNASRGKVSGR